MSDVTQQEESVVDNEDTNSEPSQDSKLADYYKSEFEKMKTEVRELVGQRDLHKKEAMELKKKYSRSKPTESEEYQQLFIQNKQLQEQLDSVRNETSLRQKKELFKVKAAEKGMSDEALKSLDLLNIDFNSIDVEKEVSAEIVVESLKSKMGFLFPAKTVPKGPGKILEGNKSKKEQYDELIKKGDFHLAKELMEYSD